MIPTKFKSILPLYVVLAALTYTCVLVHLSSAGAGEKKPNESEGISHFVHVVAVEDTDNIHCLNNDSKKVTVRLANVMPYSKWPKKLSAEEKAIKMAGLKLLTEYATDKETGNSPSPTFNGEAIAEVLHGDLTHGYSVKGLENTPARRAGWGFTNINALLIQTGATLYLRDDPDAKFGPRVFGDYSDRRDQMFTDAEAYAQKNKLGIWKNEALVAKLKAAAKNAGR